MTACLQIKVCSGYFCWNGSLPQSLLANFPGVIHIGVCIVREVCVQVENIPETNFYCNSQGQFFYLDCIQIG